MKSGGRKGTFDSAARIWMGFCSELHKGEKQSRLRSPLMTSRHDAVRPKNVYNVGSSSMTKCFEEKRGGKKKKAQTLCAVGMNLNKRKESKAGGKGRRQEGRIESVFPAISAFCLFVGVSVVHLNVTEGKQNRGKRKK